MFPAFITGFLLAFSLIIPLGVQNVFVFTQGAIQPRFRRVFPVALVAAVCDTLLILLAVFGVSLMVLTIPWLKIGLLITGVLFLGTMGWITWRSSDEASVETAAQSDWSLKRQILFTISVSLLNPHAILDTVGVIGTSSLAYTGNKRIAFTLACISVSWIWFHLLAFCGRILGKTGYFHKVSKIFNRISAVIIWGCALFLIFQIR